jgi:hypothetical protein
LVDLKPLAPAAADSAAAIAVALPVEAAPGVRATHKVEVPKGAQNSYTAAQSLGASDTTARLQLTFTQSATLLDSPTHKALIQPKEQMAHVSQTLLLHACATSDT